MSGFRSGVRPVAAGVILGGLFFASLGATAAATVALSTDAAPHAAAGSTTPSPGQSTPGSTTPSSSATPTASHTESSTSWIGKVSDAPRKATKGQVKESTSKLCDAQPTTLPRIDFQSEDGPWTKALEVLVSGRGYEPGPIDSTYTVQTRNAIRALQSDLGVTVDGVMDGPMWQALWNDECAPDPVVPPTPVYTPDSGGGGGGSGGGGGLNRLD